MRPRLDHERHHSRRLRRVSAGAVASTLALAASGCSWIGDDGPRVLVVGDSVTRLSGAEVRDELDWADVVDVRAHDGYRTEELLATTQDGVGADPDIAVVLTGYNDILQGDVETDALDTMADLVGEVPCAVWMLVPEDGTAYSSDAARRWNQRIEEAAAAHDSIHVSTAWNAMVSDSPELTFLSDFDAVHPNDQGQRVLAQAMAGAAEEECR